MPTFERDNVLLHYELIGTGLPVVYISGFSSHGSDVLSTEIRRMLAGRYQVLAVDNRGSGQTSIPPHHTATIDDMADDIAAIIDHHGLGRVHTVGISMGGCIAMTLALRHPHKVKSQVVAVSLAGADQPNRGGFMLESRHQMRQAGIDRALVNRFSAVMVLGEQDFSYPNLIEAYINAPADPFEQTRSGFDLQSEALRRYDLRPTLHTTTVPTLVVSGADDVLVPPRYQEEIARLIPGARFRQYPGGHITMLLPMYNTQFVDDVVSFWSEFED